MHREPRDTAVVIPAAGSGRRMGGAANKLRLELGGRTLLERAAAAFLDHPRVALVALACNEGDRELWSALFAGEPRVALVAGGAERQDSVRNALEWLDARADAPPLVLIHDGARPLVDSALVDRVLAAAGERGAAYPAVGLADTIRRVAGPGPAEVLDRAELFATQTPQGFDRLRITEAHRRARADGARATDDVMLLERLGFAAAMVEGSPRNLKITRPSDLEAAQWWLDRA